MVFEKQILNTYKSMMHKRCDDTETVFYFSPEDFSGLQVSSHSFRASAGHMLQGYFYQYENPAADKLVVFDHGFGGGHRAYMTEIEMLCAHGFRVFAYDHTGCMESGGETPNGLAQSLCDLHDCITMLKAECGFAERDISVVGHSWGGFSTLNITALHPEISHIVAMAGFVCVEALIETFFPGVLKGYQKAIVAFEKERNPKFASFNAVHTLSKSKTKALLIYSDNDQMVKRSHYDMLKNSLEGKENIQFLLVSGRGHNPNYTQSAVKYLGEFTSARTKFTRKKNLSKEEKQAFVSSFDWKRMTQQDGAVWEVIFTHLKG